MNQVFEVGELVIYKAFTDENVLVNYRGKTNVNQLGEPQAVVLNPATGVQGAVPLDRLDHTSLWRSVGMAELKGFDEINTVDGWVSLENWRHTYQQTINEEFSFHGDMHAIVDEVPPGRVQRVFRLRNSQAAYLAEVQNEIGCDDD